VPIGLEVDADVVVFRLLVQVLDSCGCEQRLHAEGLLEVLGGRVVGVVGLDEADGGLGGDVQQKDFRLVEIVGLALELFGNPVEEFSQDCARSISINQVQLSITLSTKLSSKVLEDYPVCIAVEGEIGVVMLSLEVSRQCLFGFHVISSAIFVQKLIVACVG
jgi:hypothetical protein